MEVPVPEVNRTELDGIQTYWIDAPRPFTVTLAFRVGTYDERLPHKGITHLVEHLAMFPNRETELNHNAHTGPQLTTFWAQGHPDQVGALMRDVCHNLHHLPLGRLDVEADVLAREEALSGYSYFDRILWSYFGPFGPGLSGSRQVGLEWLGPGDLEMWAADHFTRDNAALVIFGKPPDGFGLELPDGEQLPYVAPEMTRPIPKEPTLLDTNPDGVTWGSVVRQTKREAKPAFGIATEILTRRLHDRMRNDLGKTYHIAEASLRLDSELLASTHGFACEPAMAREVGIEHHEVISTFLEEGPDEGELESAYRRLVNAFEDYPIEVAKQEAFEQAETVLAGWGPRISIQEYLKAFERVRPGEVRDRFAEAYRQSYTVADLPANLMRTARNHFSSDPTPLGGVQFERRRSGSPESPARVRVGPDGVSLTFRQGWLNVPIGEVALVDARDDSVSIDAAALSITLQTGSYVRSRTRLLARRSVALAGGTLALTGAVTSIVWQLHLLAGTLVIIGLILATSKGARPRDGSEIHDRALTMSQAFRKYVPETLLLPPARVPSPVKAPIDDDPAAIT